MLAHPLSSPTPTPQVGKPRPEEEQRNGSKSPGKPEVELASGSLASFPLHSACRPWAFQASPSYRKGSVSRPAHHTALARLQPNSMSLLFPDQDGTRLPKPGFTFISQDLSQQIYSEQSVQRP